MKAVIETGGKQYLVKPGDKIQVEKLEGASGDAVVFDEVLLTFEGDTVAVGAPFVVGAKVSTRIVEQGRAPKVIIFRYHSKTRYRKKKGHRQPYTELEIVGVQ